MKGSTVLGVLILGVVALFARRSAQQIPAQAPKWYHTTVGTVPYRVIAFPDTKEAWQLMTPNAVNSAKAQYNPEWGEPRGLNNLPPDYSIVRQVI